MFSLATWVTLFQRAVMQGVPILFGATGEILTEKSGNLNLGIPGIMYVGGISGVIGSFLYEQHVTELNPFLAVLIPLICTLFGSLLMGLLYCFLTVTLRANQNVTGLAITTFGVGFGNFFGSAMVQLTNSDIPSIALTRTSTYFRAHLPIAEKMGAFGEMFLSYGFLAYVSIVIAIVCAVFLKRTRGGLHLRAVGENPNLHRQYDRRAGRFVLCNGLRLRRVVQRRLRRPWLAGYRFGDFRHLATQPGYLRLYPVRVPVYCVSVYPRPGSEQAGAV